MYNIFLILAIFSFSITTSIIVQAQEPKPWLYVRGDVGSFFPAKKFIETPDDNYITNRPKKGMLYNIGIGYLINDNYRFDLNLNYRYLYYKAEEMDGSYDIMTQKINLYSIFLNGYFDLNFFKKIKPYLTAGIGYGHNNSSNAVMVSRFPHGPVITDEFPGKKTNNFIWNIGIGTKFTLNDKVSLDASYKYVNLGKAKTTNSLIATYVSGGTHMITSHDIMGGVIIHL